MTVDQLIRELSKFCSSAEVKVKAVTAFERGGNLLEEEFLVGLDLVRSEGKSLVVLEVDEDLNVGDEY